MWRRRASTQASRSRSTTRRRMTRAQVQGALRQQRGAFRYIEDAAAGEGRNFYAPLCVIAPGGDMALLDGRSSEQQIGLAVTAIEPGGALSPLYIDGQAS